MVIDSQIDKKYETKLKNYLVEKLQHTRLKVSTIEVFFNIFKIILENFEDMF
jgi:hypothetical protein